MTEQNRTDSFWKARFASKTEKNACNCVAQNISIVQIIISFIKLLQSEMLCSEIPSKKQTDKQNQEPERNTGSFHCTVDHVDYYIKHNVISLCLKLWNGISQISFDWWNAQDTSLQTRSLNKRKHLLIARK